MITSKTLFELISGTKRVFQAETKEELREKLVNKIKSQKEQVKYFHEDYVRYQNDLNRREQELAQGINDLSIYEHELKTFFGE